MLAGGLTHEVSILFGIGRHFGSRPGAVTDARPALDKVQLKSAHSCRALLYRANASGRRRTRCNCKCGHVSRITYFDVT
jgi:hypothetical protein